MRRSLSLALLMAAMALSGCLPVSSASSLVGTYRLILPDSKTTLTILADHTFHEIYLPATGAAVTCDGRWTWTPDDHHINLEGAFAPRPPNSMLPETLGCSEGLDTDAMRDFSGVYLEVDPDGGNNFRKIP